jgi:hypothetical protein
MTTPPARPGRRRLVAVAVAAVLLLACCCAGWVWRNGVPLTEREERDNLLVVENHLDVALTVDVDRGQGPIGYDVGRGSYTEIPMNRACESVALVARDPTGGILGRFSGPLCGDHTWTINADGSAELLTGHRDFVR